MSASPKSAWKYLAPKPASFYKQLFVNGRIATWILHGMYVSEEEPMTAKEIADDYGLPLEAVLEAIAYCESDPPEMRSDWQREEALIKATGMNDLTYQLSGKATPLTLEERARIEEL